MIRNVRRIVVLLAGVAGLLALAGQAAHAGMSLNHCEPVR
jgi:hypothetical protein